MKNVKFRHSIILFLVLSLTILLLAGCGTNNSAEPAGSTVDTSQAAKVGLDVCTSCHSQQTADWKSGAHSNMSTTDGLNSAGTPSYGDPAYNATCTPCHDPLGDGYRLIKNWTGNVPRPVVGCESCHGGGSLHYGPGPIAMTALPSSGSGTYAQSAQFNTCTQCHQAVNATSTIADNTGESFLMIHAAVPGDTRLNTGPSATALYFVKKADPNACTACHNPHKTDTTINTQYAESAHGDPLGFAWIDYDWKYRNDADPSNDRTSCQRCHTTTGFKNFANSPTTYNPVNNDFSYLLGTEPSTTSRKDNNDQKETIYCWGCHVDNKGGLRNPGPVTADYGVVVNIPITSTTSTSITYDSVSYSYPDVQGSNICMVCHTGRRSGDSIKYLNQQAGMPPADFGNLAFINDHHYTAGGTVFTASGYEFGGRDYENNPFSYKHDKIGSAAAPDTGSNGPCVGCHMSRTEKHLFLPVDTTTGDVTGTITNVATTVCNNCHKGQDAQTMSETMLETQKALFNDALTALGYMFEKQDLYNRNGSVYRVRDTQVISAGTVTAVNGSQIITGTGTKWAIVGVEPGDKFRIDNDGIWYTIATASVVTDTQITLSSAYAGIVGASMAVNYTIRKSETVSASNGSTVVTGSGTNWLTTVVPNYDYLRIYSGGTGTYQIVSVESDTHMTLMAPYSGATVTNAAYSIRNGGTVVITDGTYTVTGTGTNWDKMDVAKGDYFRVDSDGTWYQIASRPSDSTHITLNIPYAGNASIEPYTIIRGSTRNWLSGGDTDPTGNTTGKNNMGAALNLYMFYNEPGAFVHNRYYTRRLIYDSIDWLDDGVLNYSVGATLNALPGTGVTSFKARAMFYLVPNGVTGDSAERP